MPDGKAVLRIIGRDAAETDSQAASMNNLVLAHVGHCSRFAANFVLFQQSFPLQFRKEGAVQPIASVIHDQALPVRHTARKQLRNPFHIGWMYESRPMSILVQQRHHAIMVMDITQSSLTDEKSREILFILDTCFVKRIYCAHLLFFLLRPADERPNF